MYVFIFTMNYLFSGVMKKSVLFLFILSFFCTHNNLYADTYPGISLQQASETVLEIKDKTIEGFSAVSSISKIRLLEYQSSKGPFIRLGIEGYSKNYGLEGQPHLPVLIKLIEIPYGASVKVVVTSYDMENISINERCNRLKIAPMQPSVSKNIPSELVKFQYDIASYRVDEFNTTSPVVFEAVGTTRGLSFGKLKISPFRYNPAQNSLQILNNLSFDVVYDDVNVSTVQKMNQKKISTVFKRSLASVEKLPAVASARKDALLTIDAEQPLTYVIVAHGSFKENTYLKEFIDWKEQEEFNVIVGYTGDPAVGSTKETIKKYLENLYRSADSPSYALLIGDVDKIPAWNGRAGSHVTDLYYFTYDKVSQYTPDVYYGRFPADDVKELEAIILKTLQYERFQFASALASDYLDDYMFIAGDDTPYALSHGNAQVNYAVNEYFPTTYKYLYSEDRPSLAGEIKANFNSGMGFVNYTGHCDSLGWNDVANSIYYFASSDLKNLKNKDKYGFVIGNCCLSSKFDNDPSEPDCFGENILKQRDSGAVGYIGAANDTFWDEDFYWSVGKPVSFPISDTNAENHTSANTQTGVYDGLFYTGNDESELYATAGQIVYRGNLAVTETDSRNTQYYWEVYNLMGDPSLTPYLSDPESKNGTGDKPGPGGSGDSGGTCFIETACGAY